MVRFHSCSSQSYSPWEQHRGSSYCEEFLRMTISFSLGVIQCMCQSNVPWMDEGISTTLLLYWATPTFPELPFREVLALVVWSFPGVTDHEMVELRGTFTAWPKAAYLIPEARKLHGLSYDLYFDSWWLIVHLLVRGPYREFCCPLPG